MIILNPPDYKFSFDINIKYIPKDLFSCIEFIDKDNILLMIKFIPQENKIILNSFINFNFQTSPPQFYINLNYLKKIKLIYSEKNKYLYLDFYLKISFNEIKIIKKKLSVINFNYQYILIQNLKTYLSIIEVKNNLNLFIDSLKDNTYFQKLMIELEENLVNPNVFFEKLLEKYQEYKLNIKNNLRTLSLKENYTYMNEIDQHNIDLKLNTKCKETYLINGNQSIIIYKNGDFKYNKESGYWVYLPNLLLLFFKSKMIKLLHKKEKLINYQDLSNWFYKPEFLIIKDINNYSKNTIILIITCAKNINKINILRKLWVHHLKSLGITCLFVIGNNCTRPTKIIDDVLLVNASDFYEGLPEKIFRAYQFLYENFQFNYIFKIDDDVVLNPLNLIKTKLEGDYIGIKKKIDKSFNRYWHKGKCHNSSLNNIGYPINRIYLDTYHAKGESGYFLSKKAIQSILKYEKYIITDLYEDKVFGDILRKDGIILTESNNYQPKLFTSSIRDMNINRFSVIVDVPIEELEFIYSKIPNLYKEII